MATTAIREVTCFDRPMELKTVIFRLDPTTPTFGQSPTARNSEIATSEFKTTGKPPFRVSVR
jgi:hypothetical protein